MSNLRPVKITLDWRAAGANLPPEIQEQQTQNLYRALRQLPELTRVDRVADPDVPDGGMGAQWLTDLLMTEVLPGSIGGIVRAIQQRLPGTPMDFELEVDGQKTRISMNGVRPDDFDAAVEKLVQAAERLQAAEESTETSGE
jgi:hypothetical protein